MSSLPAASLRLHDPTRLRWGWFLFACAVLLASAVAGITVGPAGLTPGQVIGELAGGGAELSGTQRAIIWDIRLPRVVLGGLVGSLLSLAGASYQGVFRNPLADPYLLGVAAGGGLGATAVIVLWPSADSRLLPLAAFAGALAAAGLTYAVGRSVGGRSAVSLILAGVAVAAFFTALQTFVLQRNSETIRQVYSWILGRLATTGWQEVLVMVPYALVCGAGLMLHRRLLDVLSVGDAEAESLGVSSARVRTTVVVLATLATAAAVAVSGLIAFVGLVVPHTVRLLVGTSYRSLIPISAVTGGAFLILADMAARTVLSPLELPIGVITAFIGAPFFMMVLRTSRRYVT
ncbi:MAG: iron ABC transporter permease [Acidimicrobiia bacterium]|nr:iron ABC transporter permease [Acidimicrobiia bacterium]